MICFFSIVVYISFRVAATALTVGNLSKSSEVMKLVNNLMKAPDMAVTMQEFSKEMTKVVKLCISATLSLGTKCF